MSVPLIVIDVECPSMSVPLILIDLEHPPISVCLILMDLEQPPMSVCLIHLVLHLIKLLSRKPLSFFGSATSHVIFPTQPHLLL